MTSALRRDIHNTKEEGTMSRRFVKKINGLLPILAFVLLASPATVTAQSVTLPTGWKTPSELYAKVAKLPADQIDKVLYEGAKKEGAFAYASPIEDRQMAILMEGFMKRYPGINAQGMGGQQEDVSNRVIAEARAGRSTFDVVSVGTFLKEYRETNALAQIHDLVGRCLSPIIPTW